MMSGFIIRQQRPEKKIGYLCWYTDGFIRGTEFSYCIDTARKFATKAGAKLIVKRFKLSDCTVEKLP